MYLVVDCYPTTEANGFRDFIGATVGCWVKPDVCAEWASVEDYARDKLHAAGWNVSRMLTCEEVSSETYANRSDGREYFEQAQLDGFVANLHVRARESIGGNGDISDDIPESLLRVADKMARDGAFSLLGGQVRQWANGVTPAGDEFVPLWASAEQVVGWLEAWPNYETKHISAKELCSGFLEQVDAAGMWIALGTGENVLTTCHCAWLLERVKRAAAS